jgi:predicted extracellular nuclease
MKKALLFLGLLSSVAQAQDCTKIFISEYVEGWSNNKALEIYNPSNVAVDLSEYFVARYSNGSASATVANAVQLSGTVPARGVFVAVLDKRDQAGTGQEAPILDSLEVRAD